MLKWQFLITDHLGTKMEKDKGEIVEDCERCKLIGKNILEYGVKQSRKSFLGLKYRFIVEYERYNTQRDIYEVEQC